MLNLSAIIDTYLSPAPCGGQRFIWSPRCVGWHTIEKFPTRVSLTAYPDMDVWMNTARHLTRGQAAPGLLRVSLLEKP